MQYNILNPEVWEKLDTSGNQISGYKTIILESGNSSDDIIMCVFKDEKGNYHLAIQTTSLKKKELFDPNVNGLNININKYQINNENTIEVIDLKCNFQGYIDEFTSIAQEIAQGIFGKNGTPINVVNEVLRRWKAFWSNQNKGILSKTETIGLICELIVLQKLLEINISLALNSWTGPLGANHDFYFSSWSFEIKGTSSANSTHRINGLDQLRPLETKNLALISFLVIESINLKSIDLQTLIEDISETHLSSKPDLLIKFNELLSMVGYSPLYSQSYKDLKLEILDSTLFEVDESFPSLTRESLKFPLNPRISSITYDITLAGLEGKKFNALNLGEYFY